MCAVTHKKNVSWCLFSLLGILMLLFGILSGPIFRNIENKRKITGSVEKLNMVSREDTTPEFVCHVKVKNTNPLPIRLCGGQLDWCGQSCCFKVITPFPMTIETEQEVTITVVYTPKEKDVSETELTLFADGAGLEGLTPIKIKLPAMSVKRP